MKNHYIVEVTMEAVRNGYQGGGVKYTTQTYEVNKYNVGDGVLALEPLDADGKLVERIFIPLCRIYNISVKRIDESALY